MSKLYTVMKNNEKIKTARSLNAAKEIADQEQAEVFCDGHIENLKRGRFTSRF